MLWQVLENSTVVFHGHYVLKHQSAFWKKKLSVTLLKIHRFLSAKTNINVESQVLLA